MKKLKEAIKKKEKPAPEQVEATTQSLNVGNNSQEPSYQVVSETQIIIHELQYIRTLLEEALKELKE